MDQLALNVAIRYAASEREAAGRELTPEEAQAAASRVKADLEKAAAIFKDRAFFNDFLNIIATVRSGDREAANDLQRAWQTMRSSVEDTKFFLDEALKTLK